MTDIEMLQLAEQALADSLIINGCDRSRRWCCSYHAGFEDGMDVLIGAITEKGK